MTVPYFFIALKTICTLRRGKKRKKIRLIFGPKNEKSRFLTVFLKMHRTKNRKIVSVILITPKQPLPDRMTHFLASQLIFLCRNGQKSTFRNSPICDFFSIFQCQGKLFMYCIPSIAQRQRVFYTVKNHGRLLPVQVRLGDPFCLMQEVMYVLMLPKEQNAPIVNWSRNPPTTAAMPLTGTPFISKH